MGTKHRHSHKRMQPVICFNSTSKFGIQTSTVQVTTHGDPTQREDNEGILQRLHRKWCSRHAHAGSGNIGQEATERPLGGGDLPLEDHKAEMMVMMPRVGQESVKVVFSAQRCSRKSYN